MVKPDSIIMYSKKIGLVLVSILLSLPEVRSLAAKRVNQASSGRSSGGGGGFGAKPTTILHTPDTSDSTLELLRFLKLQNAQGLDGVEIGFHPDSGVRGIFATKEFKTGRILCKIPSDCALALSDPAKNGEDAPTLAHTGANFLSMYAKSPTGRKLWAPYLDTLPAMGSSQFDPTPDFFSEEELELLEFPRLIRQAKERRDQVKTLAAEIDLSVEELQFATWLASSRVFAFSLTASPTTKEDIKYDDRGQIITQTGEQKKIHVLVPFIDMANHYDQPNAKLQIIDPEKDDAWFALEATRPISAGKEITIAYGNGVESSAELLLNYGFVPPSNKIDEFMLKKGGADAITSLDGWTTTLEEDQAMLSMVQDSSDRDATLEKILKFRIRLKESYTHSE